MNQNDHPHYSRDLNGILKDARVGVSEAEAELHREFVDRLVRLASSRINNRFQSKIAADEIVQSVFASFFRRNAAGDFEIECWNDLWALLVKITLRKCSTRVSGFMTAKRDVQRERSVEIRSGESWIAPVSVEPTPVEVAAFNETLDGLLDKLTPQQQEIVGLRLQGYSKIEISQKIGRTERTVYRSLKAIQKQFLQDVDGNES